MSVLQTDLKCPLCDFTNVVVFGHNNLWRPMAINNHPVTYNKSLGH